MGKKKYIRPDIREEAQILTVRAFVTKTQYVLMNPTTQTSVALQEAVQEVSNTSYAHLETVTRTNVALQTVLTKVGYALQNIFQRVK
ncbi:MAG: hypothetical protein JW882_04100 [Deltaproteobacteria bacterium]|nr:hypothetical protein [Deltaproteobacteria bacterium]